MCNLEDRSQDLMKIPQTLETAPAKSIPRTSKNCSIPGRPLDTRITPQTAKVS